MIRSEHNITWLLGNMIFLPTLYATPVPNSLPSFYSLNRSCTGCAFTATSRRCSQRSRDHRGDRCWYVTALSCLYVCNLLYIHSKFSSVHVHAVIQWYLFLLIWFLSLIISPAAAALKKQIAAPVPVIPPVIGKQVPLVSTEYSFIRSSLPVVLFWWQAVRYIVNHTCSKINF